MDHFQKHNLLAHLQKMSDDLGIALSFNSYELRQLVKRIERVRRTRSILLKKKKIVNEKIKQYEEDCLPLDIPFVDDWDLFC